MACKETIYSVSKETNQIVRVSRTHLAALQFADDSMFLCTSEFSDLKKGDTISDTVDFLGLLGGSQGAAKAALPRSSAWVAVKCCSAKCP